MVDQVLVILVANYPYGTGEPFLEAELKVIAPYFKRIIIINTGTVQGEGPSYYVPDNATVINIPISISRIQKYSSIFFQNFRHIINEVYAIRKVYKLSLKLTHLKTLFASGSKGRMLYKKLSHYIFKEQGLKNDCILYSYWCDDTAYSLALMKKKYPSVHTLTRMHGWDIYFERHSTLYLPYRQFIFRSLDMFVPISENGKQYILNKFPFVDRDKISVSRLGSPPMRSRPYDTPMGETILILSLSYILELKRLDRIIHALSSVKGKQIIWYHIGGGPLLSEIESLAKERLTDSSVSEFHFLGSLSKAQIMDFFEDHVIDCLINASDTEGIPVSMMEALSAGVPLIGPEVGGIPEIIEDGQNGFLVKSEDIMDYTQSLEAMIALSDDAYLQMRKTAYDSWYNKYNSEQNFIRFAKNIRSTFGTPYLQCKRCILDNKDYPAITFDADGICDMCHNYDELVRTTIVSGEKGKQKIEQLISEIREAGEKKPYDCLLGVSGGVDSSYMAYLCKQWGLKPLIVHVDNGWNTELAVDNIERLLNKLGFELHTEVLNWQVMRDLQLAFLKANVLDIDLPIDNAYYASLYQVANKFGIKHILTGHNTATEGNLPPNFNHFKLDVINLKDIYKKYGTLSLKGFPLIGPLRQRYYRYLKQIKIYTPLNWIEYSKKDVKEYLMNEFGWRDYGGKHYENIYTRFYQGYILPEKFGIDKRKAHLSHLICSGQISREEAMAEIESSPPYQDQNLLSQDKEYFIKKMKLTPAEFDKYIHSPEISHRAYRSILDYYEVLRPFKRILNRLLERIS